MDAVECVSPSDATVMQHNAIRRFASSNARILLTTRESCGLGMALSKVDCVVILESALRSDDDLMALDRAYQIGKTNELPVLRLFLAGTVEERMLHLFKKSEPLLLSHLPKGTNRKLSAVCGYT